MMKKIVIVLLAAVGAAALLTACDNGITGEGGGGSRSIFNLTAGELAIGEITGTITLTDVPSPAPRVSISVSVNGDSGKRWYGSSRINLSGSGTLSDISWSIPIYDDGFSLLMPPPPPLYDDVGFSPSNGKFSLIVRSAGSDNEFLIDIPTAPNINNANTDVGSLGTVSVKSVTLSGTITVTVDGQPVPYVSIWASGEGGFSAIYLTLPAKGASWSMPFAAVNSTVTFWVHGCQWDPYVGLFDKNLETPAVTVSGADVSGIVLNLGDINLFNPVNPTPLTANTWKNGEINNGGDVDWYSINVTRGTTYYLWWNDRWYGDNTKTGNIDVYALYNSTNLISFTPYINYGAWDTPVSFTAGSTGTVYIRVRAWNRLDFRAGTYAIVYSTTNSRP
jgi:predicted small secreted protein